ncbi:TRAP transporter large permease [Sulfitobacter sp. S190]|uniref:TRAP transporter large permease n=1 Tax=Sulfitobacter sp. S190 TaxID=2867022 RepID=UPI0021A9625B|nr:TRAP transporter large permease [Sulfitobacter sp. S190]UWR22126.1 TRAP transporter large permease [Sulfitobacter sp. S190]
MAWIGVAGFGIALFLAMCRVPVALAMAAVGIVGSLLLGDWFSSTYVIASLPFETIFPYGLSVVPLFIFMGVFAGHSGLSDNLFRGLIAFVGHRPGGLASSTIGACAVFGAISGSSLATCATMGKIALPAMEKQGYAPRLAGAVVAAGGTLGVLIPPSILLVIYALMTEESIGALFAGALIPGILAAALYMIAIRLLVIRNPQMAPPTPFVPWAGRIRALAGMWDAMVLITLVIGGIYAGLFSPTEAAAVGAGGALLIAALRRRLNAASLRNGMLETASMTGMIFMILIGATLFNFFLEQSRLTESLLAWITAANLAPGTVILALLVFYIVLGCFMDSLSIILLTVVPAHGLVTSLGYDPIWFGVLMVSVVEIGLITPPIGMNLFVVKGVAPRISLAEMSRGILPFVGADAIRLALLVLLPGLVLWLPNALGLGF